MRFVDNRDQVAETYPYNPNGSTGGVTAVTSTDGRVTIMMPHPERACEELLGSTDGREIFKSLSNTIAAFAA